MIRLLWALPTVIAVLLVNASMQSDFQVPVPFLTILGCVVVAGSLGGQRAGLLAGIVASLFLMRAYLVHFGPSSLTGGLLQISLGAAMFLFIGTFLGRLRDQRDTSIRALYQNEQTLENSLRKEIEENAAHTAKIAESETRLETAVRIAGIGHFTFNVETGNCEFCSDQHAAHFGLTPDEFCALNAGHNSELSFIHSDDHHIVREAIRQLYAGKAQTFEYRGLRPDGEIRYIRVIEEPNFAENGDVIENIGTSIDMTELRQAEARLRQSQRIEAIGTLTGGVAHDFNNLLAIILGNLELTLELEKGDERRELIQSAIKATLRGADLTSNLLSFSRRAHLAPTRLNLNQLVLQTMTWGARVLPETIAIENALNAELWDVELDASSAENAIINILLNSRDAMPDGGKLTIETTNMRVGEEYLTDRDEDIEPGQYVMLAISDTGHGIPADKMEKIFEPFYTGKPIGVGTGLGLSMVQGFIKQSGGAIRVYSEVGVGTTFKLYFKAAEQPDAIADVEHHEAPHLPIGQASVLLVEDEADVRRILKRTLVEAGYAVTTANSGDEALGVFKAHGAFDVLLTDVVMPGKLLGPALAKAIRLIDPKIPCIFLSGYASEATIHGNGLKSSDIRLMKPVSRANLLRAVSDALQVINEDD